MKTATRNTSRRHGRADRPTRPLRSADVLGVYDTMTEAEFATTILASRGIATSRISLVGPLQAATTQRAADGPRMVLLHGRLEDTDRAHEILADEAARAHDLEPTAA